MNYNVEQMTTGFSVPQCSLLLNSLNSDATVHTCAAIAPL